MKKQILTLGLVVVAASCSGNPDPESPAPAPEAGAAQAAAASTADSSAAPMRERMGRGEGQGMRRGEGQGMRRGEGAGMQRGEGGGMRRGQGGGMHGAGNGEGMQRGQGGGMGRAVDRPETPGEYAEGERLFEAICSQCHTVDPPPNLAPPISHVARHLGQAFDTEADFRRHVRTFVPEPDEETSVMPAHARERFGLMPALPLPDPLLDEISGYMWWLYQLGAEAGAN